jgi:hypothetical protein
LPRPEQPATTKANLADLLSAETISTAPTTREALVRRLTSARRLFSTSQYDELTSHLLALIAGSAATRRDAEPSDRDAATVILAAGYRLASELAVKRNDDALGWVLADRALTTARASGLPGPVGHASRSVAVAMRRAGHHDDAIALLKASAEQLQPGSQPSDFDLATYGALLCTSAYASAQAGRRDEAQTLLDEASAAAARMSVAVNAGELIFSTTNVTLYKIGVFTALGDSSTALKHAATVEAALLKTPERYARYCIDTARAWEQHGRHDRATQALCAAESRAPQELRRPSSHELITRLLYAPTVTPSGLRSLAARVGAIR